jgi:hypothetical protein
MGIMKAIIPGQSYQDRRGASLSSYCSGGIPCTIPGTALRTPFRCRRSCRTRKRGISCRLPLPVSPWPTPVPIRDLRWIVQLYG